MVNEQFIQGVRDLAVAVTESFNLIQKPAP